MSFENLSHSRWDCKYHIVFVPKMRKKVLYGKIRKFLGPVLRELADQRRSKILEGHMVQDYVHMLRYTGDFYQNGIINFPALMGTNGDQHSVQGKEFYIVGTSSGTTFSPDHQSCNNWPCNGIRIRMSLTNTEKL